MKKILVILSLFLLISVKGFSQFSVVYYESSTPKLGVAYNFNNSLRLEGRVYTQMFLDAVNSEIALSYNIVNNEYHNFYLGLGFVAKTFEGPTVPIGVEFRPIQSFKNFSLHVELQPVLAINMDNDILILGSGGIRYTFGKN